MPPSPSGRPDHYIDETIQEDDAEKCLSHASSLPSLATSSSPTAVSPSSASSKSTLPKALTLLGSTVILFCSFGLMNAFGAFQAWYATHQLLGMTSGNISWIGGLQLFVFFFSVSGAILGNEKILNGFIRDIRLAGCMTPTGLVGLCLLERLR